MFDCALLVNFRCDFSSQCSFSHTPHYYVFSILLNLHQIFDFLFVGYPCESLIFTKINVWLSLFRYIESMVHFASIRHPAGILDDLHGKVLNEAYQISKSTVTESVSRKV